MAAVLQLARGRLIVFAVSLLLAVVVSSYVACGAFAASGLVSTVGGAAFVQGAKQFWVTSAKPTFSGITTAGAAVSGTVGAQSVSATADASGNWSWTPTTELTGDNPVSITSGSTTASFTLTIGDLPENIASASASSLAPAGSTLNTLLVIGIGSILISAGSISLAKSFRKK